MVSDSMFLRHLKSVIEAVVIGLIIGVSLGIGLIRAATSLKVAAFVIAASPTAAETPMPLPAPTETATPSQTLTPTATFTPITPTPRATATATPRPKPTATPQPTRASTLRQAQGSEQAAPRPIAEHFLFGRPLALDAPAPAPNSMYLYGTTELSQYEVHHGVDFDRNPIGTPVFAVGAGTIVSAGDDRKPLCGEKGQTVCGRFPSFYGLVAVIQLDQNYRGQTLYALYGHIDRIDVQVGQRVKRGEPIGTVGMTGIAIGPHIQFEMRVGANDYASTRNPMLWITPLPGRGVLAGRYADEDGNLIRGAIIDIYRAKEPDKFYRETETYGEDDQPDVSSDDELGENFVMNDLPAGDYIVRVLGKPYAVRVTVPEGGLAFVEIGG